MKLFERKSCQLIPLCRISSVPRISSPLPWLTMVILELHSSKNLFDRFLNLTHQRDAPSSPSYAQDHCVHNPNSNNWLVCWSIYPSIHHIFSQVKTVLCDVWSWVTEWPSFHHTRVFQGQEIHGVLWVGNISRFSLILLVLAACELTCLQSVNLTAHSMDPWIHWTLLDINDDESDNSSSLLLPCMYFVQR